MADNVPLGMEFLRWQNAPSLTGGAVEKMMGGLKKAIIPKIIESTGLPKWLDGAEQSGAPAIPPSVSPVAAPVAPPSAGSPMALAPLPAIGQNPTVTEQDDDNLNETIWGR